MPNQRFPILPLFKHYPRYFHFIHTKIEYRANISMLEQYIICQICLENECQANVLSISLSQANVVLFSSTLVSPESKSYFEKRFDVLEKWIRITSYRTDTRFSLMSNLDISELLILFVKHNPYKQSFVFTSSRLTRIGKSYFENLFDVCKTWYRYGRVEQILELVERFYQDIGFDK